MGFVCDSPERPIAVVWFCLMFAFWVIGGTAKMPEDLRRLASAAGLRRELAGRALARAERHGGEVGFGRIPAVLYAADEKGGHGNFLAASYRRILADPEWARRLEKAYTGAEYLPRRGDRRRGELECTTSSDALLMNVFCFPGVLRRRAVCGWMGVEPGLRPEFGVRAELPMRGGEIDRTEMDMRLGSGPGCVLVEAKLTESGFGRASQERLLRYEGVEDVFDLDLMPRAGVGYAGYQIVRGILAARGLDGRYLVVLDERRGDLKELCLRVLMATRSAGDRGRLKLCTWQELAGSLPEVLRQFLGEKYGIGRAA